MPDCCCLKKSLEQCRQQLETVLVKAVAAVDAVLELVHQQGLIGGTTAVFALVSGPEILLGHLGDSKAILCQAQPSITSAARDHQQLTKTAAPVKYRQRLRAAALTCDHSPDRPDELRRIKAAGGFVSRASAGDVQSSLLRTAFTTHSSLSTVTHQQQLEYCHSSTHVVLTTAQLLLVLLTSLQWHIMTHSTQSSGWGCCAAACSCLVTCMTAHNSCNFLHCQPAGMPALLYHCCCFCKTDRKSGNPLPAVISRPCP